MWRRLGEDEEKLTRNYVGDDEEVWRIQGEYEEEMRRI